MIRIAINADVGEGFGRYQVGNDQALLPLVTAANIACGFHAGDPPVMAATVHLALTGGVGVGAHPSFPDLQGFGRRRMEMEPAEITNMVLYQIGALDAFVRAEGARLEHVKPHGALYNIAAGDRHVADAIVAAVCAYDRSLVLVGGSALAESGQAAGLRVACEAFPDRAYLADGSLAPRSLSGSIIQDASLAAERAREIVLNGRVASVSGETIRVEAQTLCVHGDSPNAVAIAQAIRSALQGEGVQLVSIGCLWG